MYGSYQAKFDDSLVYIKYIRYLFHVDGPDTNVFQWQTLAPVNTSFYVQFMYTALQGK